MSRRSAGRAEDDAADEQIAQLGLAYDLVTTQTSLVAVDETPVPDGARLTREDLPLLLPKGWDFDKLMGRDAPAAVADAPLPEMDQPMDLPRPPPAISARSATVWPCWRWACSVWSRCAAATVRARGRERLRQRHDSHAHGSGRRLARAVPCRRGQPW